MANIFVLGRNWSKRNKQRNLWCRFDGIFFEIGENKYIKLRNKKNKQDQYQQKVCDERCQRRHSFDNGKKRKSRRWLAIKRIILPFSKKSKRRWGNNLTRYLEIFLKFIFQTYFLELWIFSSPTSPSSIFNAGEKEWSDPGKTCGGRNRMKSFTLLSSAPQLILLSPALFVFPRVL